MFTSVYVPAWSLKYVPFGSLEWSVILTSEIMPLLAKLPPLADPISVILKGSIRASSTLVAFNSPSK